ncbi:MAG TPA: ABC transporter permease, partial [Terriglobales bacterium]|nr:ABC transporter permease [Terriglobales bacterium]
LIPSVQSLPGVKSAAAVNALPIVGISPLVYCCPEGAACQGIGRDPLISIREVTPGYFSSLDIPLLRGRLLNDSDNAQNRRVIVINQTAAKVFFKDKDPIGQWLENSRARIPLTVVGVVKDVPYTAVSSPPYQEMYLPREQDDMLFPSMTLVVRADSSFPNLVSAIRRKVGEIDPDVPIADVSSLDEALASSMAQPRLTMEMGALFALVALLLTVIGLYGVLAYSVSQQLTEIGIRMALGATPRQVVGLVLKSGMSIVACGLLAGIAGSLVLTRLLQGLLFGTDARDPWILAATAIVTGAAGCLACYVPARRAARVSPNLALQ